MLDALISAGANLLSGFFNRKQNDENMSMQREFNAQQMGLARENMAQQREFAQHGIRWKADDARAAGLHPLAAMGASTTSFSPVTAGGEAPKGSSMDFGSLGQDLARAAKAASSTAQREAVDEREARKLDLEHKGLQNDILRAELGSKILRTSRNGGQLGPATPSPVHLPNDLPSNWKTMVSGGPERGGGVAIQPDDMKVKHSSTPTVRNVPLWGIYDFETNPNIATGQDLEDIGGEYGGGIFSLPNIPAHLIYDFKKNKYPKMRDWFGGKPPRTFPYYR